MLQPFNTVPHVVVTPNHKIILSLLHKCNLGYVDYTSVYNTVMNCDAKIPDMWSSLEVATQRLRSTDLDNLVESGSVIVHLGPCAFLLSMQSSFSEQTMFSLFPCWKTATAVDWTSPTLVKWFPGTDREVCSHTLRSGHSEQQFGLPIAQQLD